jgi:hypothetical protein
MTRVDMNSQAQRPNSDSGVRVRGTDWAGGGEPGHESAGRGGVEAGGMK